MTSASSSSTGSLWVVRVFVIGAFVATVWLCGPRAAEVLAARFGSGQQTGPLVALDRVGFRERPAWLTDDMLLSVAESVSPWLSDEIGLLDEPTGRKLRDGLRTVAWVRDARLERVYPDRFRLHLELREPILAVHSGEGDPLCLVDEQAVMLPFAPSGLPSVYLYREGGSPTTNVMPGEVCAEPRVRVAVGIAAEWRRDVAPLVAGCPPLVEVDTTNLGERWIPGPEYPEVRVYLARSDGERVRFNYGRPVDTSLTRVPVKTKAAVLERVLERHPGLEGLIAADLRFERRWSAYLQPRPADEADPYATWHEVVPPPYIETPR